MKKLLLLLLFPATLFAQIPDPLLGTYINDRAGVLTDYQIGKINEQVHSIEKKYSVQLAIVLIGELPANYEIEDYAREIGRKWHVGNAKNGLVYVAVINQHKQRLEVAANLEGLIPDITALRLTNNIKPFFRNKDYAGGLLNMVKEIDDILNPEAQEQRRLADAEQQKKADNSFGLFLNIILLITGIGLIIGVIIWVRSKRRKKEVSQEPAYKPSPFSNHYSGSSNYIAPVVISNENNYSSGYSKRDDDYNSGSSDSSSSSSSDYGNWGSGSSDSSSSYDSGYSGGGSSNDW
jgi:uncharacterized membrane protein YgcG